VSSVGHSTKILSTCFAECLSVGTRQRPVCRVPAIWHSANTIFKLKKPLSSTRDLALGKGLKHNVPESPSPSPSHSLTPSPSPLPTVDAAAPRRHSPPSTPPLLAVPTPRRAPRPHCAPAPPPRAPPSPGPATRTIAGPTRNNRHRRPLPRAPPPSPGHATCTIVAPMRGMNLLCVNFYLLSIR
jgi:hypothetical protein